MIILVSVLALITLSCSGESIEPTSDAGVVRDAGVPESDVYKLLGQRDSRMIRRIYDRRDDSAFEYVADALPSEADMRQNNVVPIGIPGESKGIGKGAGPSKPMVGGSSPPGRARIRPQRSLELRTETRGPPLP